MKLTKIIVCLALGICASFGVSAAGDSGGKVPKILSLTAEDYKPDGCMACHKVKQIKGETVDHRLITKPDMQAVEEHREDPEFANIQTIPGDEEQGCVSCHGDFADLMHQKHFDNPTPEKIDALCK
ncbi:hypothetical protein [Vibrio sp. HN007]|uniref:hypothetical protein n=1 Tax=Vibrio iocasae TaxID=3098914 RepID=UPI0035D43FE4